MRAVIKYTKDGAFVARFKSISDAAKEVGCCQQAIHNIVSNPDYYKSVKGYVYKYEKE